MRTKQIIKGFKNSQKVRVIFTMADGTSIGSILTIDQAMNQFCTENARAAIHVSLEKLAMERKYNKDPLNGPLGLVMDVPGFRHIQLDLC